MFLIIFFQNIHIFHHNHLTRPYPTLSRHWPTQQSFLNWAWLPPENPLNRLLIFILVLCTQCLAYPSTRIQKDLKMNQAWQDQVLSMWQSALIKVHGQRSIQQHKAVANNQRAAIDAILDYRLQAQHLSIDFSDKALHTFLRTHQLKLWPKPRRPLFIWLTQQAIPPYEIATSNADETWPNIATERDLNIVPHTPHPRTNIGAYMPHWLRAWPA